MNTLTPTLSDWLRGLINHKTFILIKSDPGRGKTFVLPLLLARAKPPQK